jgi:hypothetical protein
MKEKITKDDVARLIRGKPSINRVGSRSVSHRLRADELTKLEVAILRGYLLVNGVTRDALKNSWYLTCQANEQPCLFVRHVEDGWLASVVTDKGTEESLLEDLSLLPKLLSELRNG